MTINKPFLAVLYGPEEVAKIHHCSSRNTARELSGAWTYQTYFRAEVRVAEDNKLLEEFWFTDEGFQWSFHP